MFREDFAWGVASSSYQIEGRDANDGMGVCAWDLFCEEGSKTRGHDAKVACDHIHRYKEDIKLMASLGIKSYRFSVNWCRIIPEGTGEVNKAGIDFYRDVIKEMRSYGIEPFLTLYHWELPQALEEKGGWMNEQIVDAFGEYAKVIAENFSDIVTNFFTINEPQCIIGLGYITGMHAPGHCVGLDESLLAAHNLLKAHGAAVKALRKYSTGPVKIGYAPTCTIALPASSHVKDVESAREAFFTMHIGDNWAWNIPWFADPVILGHYPEQGLKLFEGHLPKITDEDLELISQPLDFIGLNIYNGYTIKCGEDGKPQGLPNYLGYPETAVSWPMQDDCLYWGCRFAYDRYNLPIYITENGMANCDWVSLDGKVHDPARIDFVDRYVSGLQRINDEGVDIRGYFLWSFMDNFEWNEGYHGRYGIVYVDFETQERIPKDSAYWYKEIIESNGAKLNINKR